MTPFRVGVVVILASVLALRLWSVSRSSWMFDDWVYMDRATTTGFVPYLFQNYNGHVMPGEFLIVWLLTAVAPLDFSAAVWVVAVGAVAASLVWVAALRELCGARPRTLVPLALVTLSPIYLQATIWWAAALQTISLQAALGGCVYFAARLARHGSTRSRVGLLLTFAAGLLMWEKALLLVIPVAALLLYLTPRDLPRRRRRLAGELGWVAAVGGAYAVLFVAVTRQPSVAPTPLDFELQPWHVIGRWFGRLVGELLAPGLLGGPWGSLPTETAKQASPPAWQIVVTSTLLVVGIVVAVRRRRAAWVPIGMVLAYGVVSWGLIVLGRLDMVGITKVGYERYASDTFMVLCLAVGMLLAPEAARGRPATSRRAAPSPASERRTVAVAVVGSVAVAGSLLVANVVAVDRIGVSPARSWVRNVVAGIADREPIVLADDHAPPGVLFQPFWGEAARLSNMLAPLGPAARFHRPADQVFVLSQDGEPVPARVEPAARARPGPVQDCGYALGPGDSVVLPMTVDLYDQRWGVQLNAFTSATGALDVEVAGETIPFPVHSGLNAPIAVVVGPVDQVRATSKIEDGVICVTDVIVGPLRPTAG